MRTLPRYAESMPASLTIEKPASHLASLSISDSLRTLSDVLIRQWRAKAAFAPLQQYGIRPLDRALFFGPPGNGKTVAAQMIASKLGCPLYRVCCESLLDSMFGGTSKNIAEVMDWIAGQGVAVVLWDECESLFPDRSAGAGECHSALARAMQIFWQRLDRWESPQLFLLATNLVDRIDPALISRIDLRLKFGPPTQQQALDVLAYWAEVLHEYGTDVWAVEMRSQISAGALPVSFRELWQDIQAEVRSFVLRRED